MVRVIGLLNLTGYTENLAMVAMTPFPRYTPKISTILQGFFVISFKEVFTGAN